MKIKVRFPLSLIYFSVSRNKNYQYKPLATVIYPPSTVTHQSLLYRTLLWCIMSIIEPISYRDPAIPIPPYPHQSIPYLVVVQDVLVRGAALDEGGRSAMGVYGKCWNYGRSMHCGYGIKFDYDMTRVSRQQFYFL